MECKTVKAKDFAKKKETKRKSFSVYILLFQFKGNKTKV